MNISYGIQLAPYNFEVCLGFSNLNLKLETVQIVQDEPTNLSEELGILDSRAHHVSPAGEPGDTVFQKTTHEVDKDTDFDHDKNRIIRMKLFLSPNKERSL